MFKAQRIFHVLPWKERKKKTWNDQLFTPAKDPLTTKSAALSPLNSLNLSYPFHLNHHLFTFVFSFHLSTFSPCCLLPHPLLVPCPTPPQHLLLSFLLTLCLPLPIPGVQNLLKSSCVIRTSGQQKVRMCCNSSPRRHHRHIKHASLKAHLPKCSSRYSTRPEHPLVLPLTPPCLEQDTEPSTYTLLFYFTSS